MGVVVVTRVIKITGVTHSMDVVIITGVIYITRIERNTGVI